MFVMMNPSTADTLVDDPTVAKCCCFARACGYGGIFVGNSFAYRATDQKCLLAVDDPIGPDNDRHLVEMAKSAAVAIFAYGKPHHCHLRSRGPEVAKMLIAAGVKPHMLKVCSDGTPQYPLYLLESLKPTVWRF